MTAAQDAEDTLYVDQEADSMGSAVRKTLKLIYRMEQPQLANLMILACKITLPQLLNFMIL